MIQNVRHLAEQIVRAESEARRRAIWRWARKQPLRTLRREISELESAVESGSVAFGPYFDDMQWAYERSFYLQMPDGKLEREVMALAEKLPYSRSVQERGELSARYEFLKDIRYEKWAMRLSDQDLQARLRTTTLYGDGPQSPLLQALEREVAHRKGVPLPERAALLEQYAQILQASDNITMGRARQALVQELRSLDRATLPAEGLLH